MSERLEFKGDYMGFTYNNTHSSTLGIVRTSDGSRFNENLLPTIQDKTVQVPGGDGTYFFGSYYTQRQFSVSFAFDSLTEEQIGEIRRVFGDKQIHDLIFDERPYKVYSAKVTGTATIKYISFDEGDTNRLYKGEGTIQFTCYNPFARCWSTEFNDYQHHWAYLYPVNGGFMTYENWEQRVMEWWEASRIEQGGNFGDRPVPFKVDITKTEGFLEFGNIKWSGLPEGKTITLNTKIGIAKDAEGNIYNKYFTGDLTAKIPIGATAEQTAGLDFTCLYI